MESCKYDSENRNLKEMLNEMDYIKIPDMLSKIVKPKSKKYVSD